MTDKEQADVLFDIYVRDFRHKMSGGEFMAEMGYRVERFELPDPTLNAPQEWIDQLKTDEICAYDTAPTVTDLDNLSKEE